MWRPLADIIKESGHTRDIRVPFNLKYIEALLNKKPDYATKFIDSWISNISADEIINTAASWDPDIIVVSVTTSDQDAVLSFAKTIKKRSSPHICVIGQDPSTEPDRYVFENSPVDSILRGEPELSFINLVSAIKEGSDIADVKGIYTSNKKDHPVNIISDINVLPFPQMNKNELKKYKIFYPVPFYKKIVWGHILTSRGCPHKCTFCSQTIRESFGSSLRFRNIDSILEEIKRLQSLGVNLLYIADDDFTCSPKHVESFCTAILKAHIKIKWTVHARVDEVSLDLLKIMKKAGCIQLRFGIESSSESVLNRIHKTAAPNEWVNKATCAFQNAKKCKIDTLAMFLVGSPGETETDVRSNIKLAKELEPDLLQLCFFTAYPGSSHYKEIKDLELREKIRNSYHYQESTINFSNMDAATEKNMYITFYRSFYLRIGYIIKHILKYSLFYLFNTDILWELLSFRKILWCKKNDKKSI